MNLIHPLDLYYLYTTHTHTLSLSINQLINLSITRPPLIHSFTHSPSLIQPLIHPLIHSLAHLTARSLPICPLSGDPIYRDWSWEIFQSIDKHCKTPTAYGALRQGWLRPTHLLRLVYTLSTHPLVTPLVPRLPLSVYSHRLLVLTLQDPYCLRRFTTRYSHDPHLLTFS